MASRRLKNWIYLGMDPYGLKLHNRGGAKDIVDFKLNDILKSYLLR